MVGTYNEILLGLKKNEILARAMSWVDLEDTVLNDVSRQRRTNVVRFHLYEVPRAVKCTEAESGVVVCPGWRREAWAQSFSGGGESKHFCRGNVVVKRVQRCDCAEATKVLT